MISETEQTYDNMFIDEREFESKFLLTPNIDEDSDFRHLDKNLAITRLSSRYAEPERARAILIALHTLTQKNYFGKNLKNKLMGFKEVEELVIDDDGQEMTIIRRVPVFEEKEIDVNRYPKTYHKLKSMFYGLTTTAAARDGHLLRASRSKTVNQNQSLDDKTQNKSGFSFFKPKRKNGGDYYE